MELYLVRHGETAWNKEGRYYGHSDIGLSDAGLVQAKELGSWFRSMEFDKVICSPLIRAVQTAKELTDQHLVMDERLKEQNFGVFEGETYTGLLEKYAEELDQWNHNYETYCIPEGESFRMVRHRVDDFVKDLWQEKGRVLIVAHKGTFGHMLASLLQMPDAGYWNFVFEQGTYSKIDLQDGFAIIRALNRKPEAHL